jgi:ribosomal protein S18 acetylase RimI-like enzyme
MSGDVAIRQYADGDLQALKAITIEAFDGVSIDQIIERRFGLLGESDWKARKAGHIDDDVRRDVDGMFVAEQDGQVVGYITTWRDAVAGIGHIPNLAVREGYRTKGIGRRMIQHALDYFEATGLTHARIETLAHNEAGDHLYRAMGFEEITRQIHFIRELGGD